jgi:hypothetical protein
MEKTNTDPEPKERSLTGDSSKDSRDGSSDGDLPCSKAVQRATAQNLSVSGTGETPQGGHLSSDKDDTGNLEVLAKKVGILDLRPGKEIAVGLLKSGLGGLDRRGLLPGTRPAANSPPPPRFKAARHRRSTSGLQGKGKCQGTSGSTPEDRRAKRPRSSGQPSYARVTQEGLSIAIVCDGYPKVRVTKDDFQKIQRAIGALVDGLPEEGFTPKLVDTYWAKGAAIVVCLNEETKDWLGREGPKMNVGEGSKLRMEGLEVLPTYKRVVAWFPGPREDTERLFQRFRRLNRVLDTSQWRVYERKEGPNGVRVVLSMDSQSVTTLEGLKWKPFSGVAQAVFSLLGVKPEGKK